MTKYELLCELGLRRKRSTWAGYHSVNHYHAGAYDCEYVSPYSKGASNANASIFVLLQDWSSDEWLNGPLDSEVLQFGYSPKLPTNKNLSDLLERHFGAKLKEIFATNLFPFVKPGNLSSAIPAKLMRQAADEFAVPQIQAVRPKIVVCLGTTVFNALRSHFKRYQVKTVQEGFDNSFSEDGIEYWCQAHTGALGRINREHRGGRGCVDEDWKLMAISYGQMINH